MRPGGLEGSTNASSYLTIIQAKAEVVALSGLVQFVVCHKSLKESSIPGYQWGSVSRGLEIGLGCVHTLWVIKYH